MADITTRIAAIQFWAIEASAQALETAAQGFCEVAPGDVTASGLADSYGMAANEVRLQIPAYAQMKERNLAAIKAWDKASAPPKLEHWEPMKYAPGGLGPDRDASGVAPVEAPSITTAWNKVRAEARELAGTVRPIARLLAAVDEYGMACAKDAAGVLASRNDQPKGGA